MRIGEDFCNAGIITSVLDQNVSVQFRLYDM